ncbi:cysteine-rich CWC family protein [Ferriphaselus sp. R-1]|uniref:cysteine-rich CWC family protein n=1 Tax=Ferriphaselus sp. R-1 TaxID=1485544 RepID=UPI000A75E6B7|nr:cysteine-rich CWC family protein [Ferriphaselus sp. R-1]
MSAADCPLCGGDNRCAMAQGESAAECWCQRVTIPADVLAQVPERLRGQACVCAGCCHSGLAPESSKSNNGALCAPLDSRCRGNDGLV